MDHKFASHLYPYPYPYPFRCGVESETSSAFGNMRLSEYYTWDIQAMIPQSPVHPSKKNFPPPVDVKGEITELATSLNDGASETTGAAVLVKKI